jgi:hypothetical protein
LQKVLVRDALVLLFFVGLTVVLTYPVAFHAATTVPSDPGDPLLVTWLLGWNYHTLLAGRLSGYWDANMFYPMHNALALNDHFAFPALLGLPVYWLTRNLLVVYNVLILVSFALTGYAVFRLALYLVPSVAGAIFAGTAFAFTTYRFEHLSHLDLLQTQWLPLIVLNFIAFVRERKAIHAVGLGAFFFANALSAVYYLIFVTILLALIFPLLLAGTGRVRDGRLWVGLLVVGVLVAAATLPFLAPYNQVKSDLNLSRSTTTTVFYSARPHSFLSGPGMGRLYAPWLTRIWRPETNFFPGLLPIALGLGCLLYPRNRRVLREWLGAMFAFRPRATPQFAISASVPVLGLAAVGLSIARSAGAPIELKVICRVVVGMLAAVTALSALQWRKTRALLVRYAIPGPTYRGLFLLIVILAVLLSMGPKLVIFGERTIRGPYYLLFRFVPGINGLRVVGRFAVLAVLALSVLAAYGFADFERRWAGRPYVRWALAAALFVGMVIESLSIPIRTIPVPTGRQIPPVYHWLAEQPGECAIAEIPMGDIWDDIRYVYCSTVHWKNLVNGYGSFFPPDYTERAKQISEFPAPEAVDTLKQIGARYLIFHTAQMGRPAPESPGPGARLVQRFGDDAVYEISPKEP